jgi:serine/threonine protein phosphatase PrpC
MTQWDRPTPTYRLSFETGFATHVGKIRQANEDAAVALPDFGVWAVADGMGGHDNGQFASQTLTQDIGSTGLAVSAADQVARFKDRVMRANDTIRQAAEAQGGATIGTTLTSMLAYEHDYVCVWAGDSRTYLLRDGVFQQVTRDHTEAQELVDSGVLTPEQVKTWPRRNVITRAIGIFEDPELEQCGGPIKPADTFVLCSDGLTGHLSDEEIGTLAATLRPQAACDALIETTLARGASDNVTVVIVRCHATEPTIPPFSLKPKAT